MYVPKAGSFFKKNNSVFTKHLGHKQDVTQG